MSSRDRISLRKIVTTDVESDEEGVKLGDVVVTSAMDSGHRQNTDFSGIISSDETHSATNDR